MSTTAPDSHADARRVELSRTEQWVLHDVMVSRCQEAQADRRTPPWWAVGVVEKLEGGTPAFTDFEAWRVCRDLDEYASDEAVPPEEADAARSIVEQLRSEFDPPPRDRQD